MIYKIEGDSMLIAINRTDIQDISVNDTLQIKGIESLDYKWTDHDAEFIENNPDDDIFLKVKRTSNNQYSVIGIQLREHETQY
jgi:hypothetical protein